MQVKLHVSQEEVGSQKMSSLNEMLYLSELNSAANNRNPTAVVQISQHLFPFHTVVRDM